MKITSMAINAAVIAILPIQLVYSLGITKLLRLRYDRARVARATGTNRSLRYAMIGTDPI